MNQTASKNTVNMALILERLPSGQLPYPPTLASELTWPEQQLHQCAYVKQGTLTLNNTVYSKGEAVYIAPTNSNEPAIANELTALRFLFNSSGSEPTDSQPASANTANESMLKTLISTSADQQRLLVMQQRFDTPLQHAILRLDQVDFPAGAIAYKHTHPGGGIRYLTHGSLALHTDASEHHIAPGEAWFEAADSAVTAVSDKNQSSQFIRLLLLPTEYQAKSSFTLVDKSDADKPRLQTNHRFFDHAISL